MKVIIIGGVAAGASCAARLSRLDKNAEIIIYEKSGFVSYANCGIPYFLGDVIDSKSKLTIQNVNSLKNRYNINAKVNSEVIKIDRVNKKVIVKDLINDNIYEDNYDKLVIATGSSSTFPNIKGINNKKVFKVKNIEDAFYLKDYINITRPKNVIIIGGGYVGIEIMENLSLLNINVTLLESNNQVLSQFDSDFGKIIANIINNNNYVNLKLNEKVLEIVDNKNSLLVRTNNDEYNTDLVIMCAGIKPENKLAVDAGLETGYKDTIVVNEFMQTSDKDIYAGGDVVSVKNIVTNKIDHIPLAGPANKQGRIIANNIAGIVDPYKGANPVSILKLFDYTLAVTGINERRAKELNINYETVITTPVTNASYYPIYSNLFIKVIYERKTKRILGGQIIGKKDVDKPIDTLSTLIYKNGTSDDLVDIDLAYSPVYSSPKNPLNMIGFIIENIESGLLKQWDEDSSIDSDSLFVDIRDEFSYSQSHFENAINIPLNVFRENINKIDKNKKIYLNCYSGLTSYIASRILSLEGYDCYNYKGGYNYYSVKNNLKKLK